MDSKEITMQGLLEAFNSLIMRARLAGAMHLNNGVTRLAFARDMTDYADQIIDDVETGHLPLEDGLEALQQAYIQLQKQVLQLNSERLDQPVLPNPYNALGPLVTEEVDPLELITLMSPPRRPFKDAPVDLLRYVRRERLQAVEVNQVRSTTHAAPPPVANTRLLTPDQWPAEVKPQEPGFYVVPKSTTFQQLQADLFTTKDFNVLSKFKSLNPGREQVKAGQLIVLSDPNNLLCTREEAQLMAAAQRVNEALESLTPEEADFMAQHHDEIESFITHGVTAVGIGEAMFAKHLEDVKKVLVDIENLHKTSFNRHGNLQSVEFFAERRALFNSLNLQLTALTKKVIGFPDHPDLKNALGISSRSLVHRWTLAGGPDQIPGYATHINGVSKAAKYIKYGGWVATGIGGGVSYMKVQEVCAAGNTEMCKKIRFTETGAFAGGVLGGAAAGVVVSQGTAGAICAVAGVPTGGAAFLVCGLILAGASAYGAGYYGGMGGDVLGELFYESSK